MEGIRETISKNKEIIKTRIEGRTKVKEIARSLTNPKKTRERTRKREAKMEINQVMRESL